MIQRLQVRLAHMHFLILMRSTSTTHDSTVLLSAPIKNTAIGIYEKSSLGVKSRYLKGELKS